MTARSNRLGVDPAKMAQPRPPEEPCPAAEPTEIGPAAVCKRCGKPHDPLNPVRHMFEAETEPNDALSPPTASVFGPPALGLEAALCGSPPSPPTLSSLIASVVDLALDVEALTREAHAAEANRVRAVERHARAMSDLAQRASADGVEAVEVGGVLFRPVPPRKVGGAVPEGATWGLRPVRVAK